MSAQSNRYGGRKRLMVCFSRGLGLSASLAFCAWLGAMVPATSADLGPQPVEQLPQPVPPLNQWQFSFTPYAWLPWISGDVVVKGRPFDVAIDPADLITHLDWPDIVPVWMSYTEARRGPLSLFNDIVYANVNGGTGFSRTVSGRLATATFGGNISADYQLAIVEAGGAYAIWSRGSQGYPDSTAFDLLAGARYWHQDVDISADVTGTVALNGPLGLTIIGKSRDCEIRFRRLGRSVCRGASSAAAGGWAGVRAPWRRWRLRRR